MGRGKGEKDTQRPGMVQHANNCKKKGNVIWSLSQESTLEQRKEVQGINSYNMQHVNYNQRKKGKGRGMG